MSATTTQRSALTQGAQLYQDISSALDERTLEILERRRKTAVVRRRGWLVRRALVVADILGILLAFLVAQVVWGAAEGGRVGFVGEILVFVLTIPAWILVTKLYGLYEHDEQRTDHTTVDDLVSVFHVVTVGAWLLVIGSWLTSLATPDLPKLVTFWAMAIVLVTAGRASARGICRRRITYLQNTVIVGAGDVGQTVARKIRQHPEYGLNLIGFVDSEAKESSDATELTVLGPPELLPAIVRVFDVERVVIAFSLDSHEKSLELIRSLRDLDVQVDIVPRLFEIFGPRVGIHMVEGLPLVGLPPLRLSRWSLFVKRELDVILAALSLIVLSPLFAYIALRIRLDSPGPVLYRSERVGKNGRTFSLLKFRTMRLESCLGDGYGGDGASHELEQLMSDPGRRAEFEQRHKFEDDPRLTRYGKFLRRTSLDELPQLLNVLKGDLSLVGPRAITTWEQAHMVSDSPLPPYWEVKNLLPGVTGYWQIAGRSLIGYDERLRLDRAYVMSWSLKLDLTILAKTLRVLLLRNGAV